MHPHLAMVRSPYFEAWMASLCGLILVLWPQSPWIWALSLGLFVISKSRMALLSMILLAVLRTSFEIAAPSFTLKIENPKPTYEPVIGLPKEVKIATKASKEWDWVNRLRTRVENHLDSSEGLLAGFRKAILLGETRDLPASIWDPLNYLGLSHLLVISGSHITFILSLILGATRVTSRHLKLQWNYASPRFVALVLVSFFLLIANRDLSILRAFFCFAIIAIGSIFIPQFHRLRPSERLSMVAIVMIWIVPMACIQSTYILSFGTSWALLRSHELNLEKSKAFEIFSPFAFVFAACGILGLGVHPISIVANLFFGVIFIGILIPLAIVSIGVRSLEKVAAAAVQGFFQTISWLSEMVARHWPVDRLSMSASILFLIALLIIFQMNDLSLRARKWAMIVSAGLFCVATSVPKFSVFNRRGVDIHILDIGQGDGILLRFDHKNIMIDGGGPYLGVRQLLPSLRENFAGEIDLWVLSHFDRDHRGNFEEVESRVSISEIWVPRWDKSQTSTSLTNNYAQKARAVGRTPAQLCSAHYCWSCFSLTSPTLLTKVGNADSLVCALSETESGEILFLSSGDLTGPQEPSVLSKLDEMGLKAPATGILALKLAHHGSKTSTTDGLLDALHPQTAIINLGRHNQYSFPHGPVIDKLVSRKIPIFRVDALGNFKLHFDN